jgi:tRNA-specific 2-thiouridylase
MRINPVKMNRKEKVLVAMSGGVDSSVTAALLQEDGFEVRGITLVPWHSSALGFALDGHPDQTVAAAQLVSKQLGIKVDVLELTEPFYEKVIGYFREGYREGKTPNPCFICNRVFKWFEILKHADLLGFDFIATGHYAQLDQLPDGRTRLFKAIDLSKDQSYVLSCLDQAVLKRIILPLGRYNKAEVREIAAGLNIVSANRSDSQDLCFVRNEDHKELIKQLLGKDAGKSGDIVNNVGQIIGQHDGLENYTYGQRKGIRIAAADPYYVIGKNIALNQLIVGPKYSNRYSSLLTGEIHWIGGFAPSDWFKADVKIRYHAEALPAMIKLLQDGSAEISFSENVPGITPGQFAVIYNENEVLGAGEIIKEIDKR